MCPFANYSHSHTRARRWASRRCGGEGAAACLRLRQPAAFLLAALLDRRVRSAPRSSSPATTAPRATWRPTCRAFLAPRAGPLLPGRGVRYESHLAPPPHLVGPADRRARRAPGARRRATPRWSSASAAALTEKVPDPELRPHGFAIEKGELLDLDETARAARRLRLRARRPGGGPRPVRGPRRHPRRLPGHRGARRALRAVRRRGRAAAPGSRPSPSARWRTPSASRSRPAAELAPEHRELAEIAAASEEDERPDVADVLPVDRFRELLDLIPDDALVAVAAEEELRPSLRRPLAGRDARASTTRTPTTSTSARPARGDARRAAPRCASRASPATSRTSFRAQGADTAARSLKEAEPELEKLVRSGYRTVVAWARRGEAERAALQPRPARTRDFLDGEARRRAEPGVLFAHARPARGLPRAAAEARGAPRAPPAAPPPRRAPAGPAPRRADAASPSCAPATPVVHDDHGIARFIGFETKTVGGVTRDYLELEYRDGDRVFVPSDQLAQDQPLRRRRRRATRRSRSSAASSGSSMKLRARRAAAGAGRRADQPLRGAQAPRRARVPARTREWQLEFEDALPLPRDARPARRDRGVKADMEEARPMDRLICGDVGYGKTEVALRAAFKAAEDGKQVLFLVPTTILAQQHFGTFTERLRDYPFPIEVVSRFRSAAEVKRGARPASRGQGRHPDRHAPAALARRAPEGPRPADRGRGAALRRQAEGAAAPAEAEGRRAVAVGDADPAHAADVARRPARHLGDRDAAGGPPAGAHLRRRVRRGARQAGDRARAGARRPGLLPAQPRGDDRRGRRAAPGARAAGARVASPTARWTRGSSRR